MTARHMVAIALQLVGFISLVVGLWTRDWHLTVLASCLGFGSAVVVGVGLWWEQRR